MKYLVIICMLLSLNYSISQECGNIVKTCDKVIEEQDKSIKNLKEINKRLMDDNVDLTKPPIVPQWVIVVGSIVGGMLLAVQVRK